jgi:hypothetical protein
MGISATIAATAVAASAAKSVLTPKTPKAPPVVPMPDQTVIDQAARKSAAQQLSRTGRASTVLSAGTDTGDRLGP